MSRTQAGVLLIVVLVVISYLGFTKAIPFRHHFEIKADFRTSNNLRINSLVRIAGVNVGKVTDVQFQSNGKPGVRVTMRIDPAGRPIHKDATVSLRPRIFLEGNLFVDLHPGSPTAPVLGDGELIPDTQTSTPVQLDQILTSLQADTRSNLQRVLAELSTALSGDGGLAYNRAIQYWLPAFRGAAIVNDATLGTAPHDLSRYLAAQGRFAAALDRNPPALKSLITDFNTTAGALAHEQVALENTLTELPRTLRVARPALAALNSAFPPVRRLTADLRPAVRSTPPTIDASLPFITQLRLLVSPDELQGFTDDLRRISPELAKLNAKLPDLYNQVRLASSCQNNVILPWSRDKVIDANFPAKGKVFQEAVKGLPGLAEESRSGDANQQWARTMAGNGLTTYGLQVGGLQGFGLTNFPLEGVNPPVLPFPAIRYDVPCETQQPPVLESRPAKSPPLLAHTSHLSLPLARLGEARSAELAAQMLAAQGQGAKAKRMAAQGLAIRRRYHLMGKKVGLVDGRVAVVDASGPTVQGKSPGQRGGKAKGKSGRKGHEQASSLAGVTGAATAAGGVRP